MTTQERRAWRDLVRGLRMILVGHRDAKRTESEAGMMVAADAERRLRALGQEPTQQ